MISKVRAFLDDGFIVGLVFSLFLASKIVPFLIVVGVVPIAFFWMKSDYVKSPDALCRFLIPTVGYFAFSVLLFYIYPGLQPGEKPPGNPDGELYAVAIALIAAGFLRGLQIRNLNVRFQTIAPWSLLASFAVLSGYMFLGVHVGCRVQGEASWPFIPAVIFTTLTFLTLLGWERMTRRERLLRLILIALSIVVVLGYTGARGVAVGQFGVLLAFALLRLFRRLRSGLPTLAELAASVAGGLLLCFLVQATTGCGNFDRMPAVFDLVRNVYATQVKVADPAATAESVPQPVASDNQAVPASAADVVDTTSALSADMSITLRLNMWVASLEAFRQAPIFGHGALSLRPIIQDRFGFEHNHNQYLAWLVTGGIVFLAIGLLFLSTPFLISKGLATVDRAIVTLSVTGLWGIAMMFDAFLNLDFYLHYFSMLLGFLFALTSDIARSQPARTE